MTIFVNLTAGGGRARARWREFIAERPDIERTAQIRFTESVCDLDRQFKTAISSGEIEFVAAGGDGTVSSLLQLLVAASASVPSLKLGAIGLGSSNDFHKPFTGSTRIPTKLNFTEAVPRDVGVVQFASTNPQGETRYWLLNASIGVTAEANAFFNFQESHSKLLSLLKRRSTDLAILYAALHTLARYRNRQCIIDRNGTRVIRNVTNLGIVKSPHFAGDFCYDSPLDLESGLLHMRLASDLTKGQVLQLMHDLGNAHFGHSAKRESSDVTALRIESPQPFALEFDGEVVRTTAASFSLLPHFLTVCP